MSSRKNVNVQKNGDKKFDIPFIIFLVICIPILIINLVININPDKVPDIFGYKPLAVVSRFDGDIN